MPRYFSDRVARLMLFHTQQRPGVVNFSTLYCYNALELQYGDVKYMLHNMTLQLSHVLSSLLVKICSCVLMHIKSKRLTEKRTLQWQIQRLRINVKRYLFI